MGWFQYFREAPGQQGRDEKPEEEMRAGERAETRKAERSGAEQWSAEKERGHIGQARKDRKGHGDLNARRTGQGPGAVEIIWLQAFCTACKRR